jgi:sulfopyruvate decarboxylase subunit alpha
MHVPVANEQDGIGICAGAYLGGKKPAFLGENAGFVLATYALLSTIHVFGGFPMLLVVDHRGDFGEGVGYFYYGAGIQLPRILDLLQIPYTIVRESNKLIAEVVRGGATAEVYGKPAAILLSGEEMYGN